MSRRGINKSADFVADCRYDSQLVGKMINIVMRNGEKSIATKIVYGALDYVGARVNEDPFLVFKSAVFRVRPTMEARSCRVGGVTYRVPVEVSEHRGLSLGMKWIRAAALGRKSVPMLIGLGSEIIDAYNDRGAAIKKREDNHKMAESNRAFAHFRWFNKGKRKVT